MPWPWSPAISSPRRWWWRWIASACPTRRRCAPAALSLFRAGSISVASAAQVAGLPLPRFLEILSSLKIPVVEGDAADLQEDLANARRWLNSPPERHPWLPQRWRGKGRCRAHRQGPGRWLAQHRQRGS